MLYEVITGMGVVLRRIGQFAECLLVDQRQRLFARRPIGDRFRKDFLILRLAGETDELLRLCSYNFV